MVFRKRPKPINLEHLDDLDPLIESGLPILLDFWRQGCQPCRLMDGIVKELAEEYVGEAHVVRVDIGSVPGAIEKFRIQSTPTFVVLGRSRKKPSKKARQRGAVDPKDAPMTARFRTSGMTRKDQLAQALESNGAHRVAR
ncbi:MAG: thioredoxin family protein [Actinobacteria bacterium]|nr:thioredoxin family protein [Actinomycetota bacterium]MBU1493524.1 thioredoxin family protein [Actinomycetota bacterium]MBU1866623.1 thioredoxin family protein [Actinomycetota bacterium]